MLRAYAYRRRHDGQDRLAVQAARLRVPEQRDLRRPGVELRLRPLRGPAQEQRQEPVVAGDAPGARRRGRARLGDHPAPADVGGERPPGRLHRPAGRLPHLQAPLPRGPSRPVGVWAQAVQAPRRDPRMRPDRGARLQPDVRDDRRPGQGGGLDRLPAPRDRPGDLPQLQELPAVLAQEAAVRDRPDRQELPQRDHHRELHLPHARVRADGDGVLRAPGRGRQMARALAGGADELVDLARAAPRPPAAARRTTPTSSRTTRARPATSSTCSRSAGPSSRGSPTGATSTSPSTPSSRARSSSTSTPRPASATCRT